MINADDITFRIANSVDISSIVEICQDPALENPNGDTPNSEWVRDLVSTNMCCVALDSAGVVVGAALAERLVNGGAMLWILAVRATSRAQGLGSLVLAYF